MAADTILVLGGVNIFSCWPWASRTLPSASKAEGRRICESAATSLRILGLPPGSISGPSLRCALHLPPNPRGPWPGQWHYANQNAACRLAPATARPGPNGCLCGPICPGTPGRFALGCRTRILSYNPIAQNQGVNDRTTGVYPELLEFTQCGMIAKYRAEAKIRPSFGLPPGCRPR